MSLFGSFSGRSSGAGVKGTPLVVAIHGGTYTSAYFDVPGHSLFDKARLLGIDIIAIDRPGYGHTPLLNSQAMTLKGQATYIASELHRVWESHGAERSGVVLLGHSIGAAIAAMIASSHEKLPLLGLAISGVGMRTPPEHRAMWGALPKIDLVSLPDAMKDEVMFGPPGSYPSDMPAASHVANTTAPRVELVDIVGTWQDHVRDVLGSITVPVHYRQGEHDHLWIVGEGEVADFKSALTASPSVDAALVPGMGHCLDYHCYGPTLQEQQLQFALRCST
jgi:pimeloyl-ACP methyl ester carboxylesterase